MTEIVPNMNGFVHNYDDNNCDEDVDNDNFYEDVDNDDFDDKLNSLMSF